MCICKSLALLSVFCLRVSPRFWSSEMRATEGISHHLCVQVSVDSAYHYVCNLRGSETFNGSSSEFKEKYNHNFVYMESKATHISRLVVWRHGRRKEADILKRKILLKWLANDSLFLQVDLSLKKKIVYLCLHWVFDVCELSLAAASRSYSSLQCVGFSVQWILLLQNTSSRSTGFSSYNIWAQ